MPDPIVIDTNAMQDRGFRPWLYNYRGRKIFPLICFVELSVFLRSRGRSIGAIKGLLKTLGVEIEPFHMKYAYIAIETGVAFHDFKKNWRDHMIGAHAHTAPLRLITYNQKDFQFLGDRVMSPQDAMQKL